MRRLTMVVTGTTRAAANAAAKVVPDGGDPFDVPLRAAGDTRNRVVAHWCSWVMQDAEADALLADLTARGLAKASVHRKDAGAPAKGQGLYVFDGEEWTPEEILAALELDRLTVTAP